MYAEKEEKRGDEEEASCHSKCYLCHDEVGGECAIEQGVPATHLCVERVWLLLLEEVSER